MLVIPYNKTPCQFIIHIYKKSTTIYQFVWTGYSFCSVIICMGSSTDPSASEVPLVKHQRDVIW